MKTRSVILLLLLLPFAACDRKEGAGAVVSDAIQFSSPSLQTRSLINDVSQLTDGFVVYASRYNAEYVDNKFFDNVKVGRDGTYEGEYYWTPGAGHEFFAAYSEGLSYAIDATGKTLNVTGTGPEGKVQAGTDDDGNNILKDILYDIALYDEPYVPGESDPGKIKFDLKHACSAISFSINNLSGKNITSVAAAGGSGNVEITGLYDEGGLSFSMAEGVPTAQWSSLAQGTATLTLPALTVTSPDVWSHGTEKPWDTLVIIPQNFASLEVQMGFMVTYEGGSNDTYEVTLSDIKTGGSGYEYQAGKHYKYKIDITNQDIMCYVDIVPWIEDETIVLE